MALTQVQSGILADSTQTYGMKNRIINGDMRIDQRNAGAQITPSTSGNYTLDRWAFSFGQASKFNIQQNGGGVTPPAGFTNYLGATVASAVSSGADDYFILHQAIEGYNMADWAWGTAAASPVTISFWVRSSLTGTHGGCFRVVNSTFWSCPFSYTITSANTWEYKTVTIPAQTFFAITTTNNGPLYVFFDLGVGANNKAADGWASGNKLASSASTVSVVGTAGATWYITGVQIEKGSTATQFDTRSYGTELQMCQRYCYVIRYTGSLSQIGMMTAQSSSSAFLGIYLPTTPRVYPTGITASSGTCVNTYAANSNVTSTSIAIGSGWTSAGNYAPIYITTSGGLTAGQAGPVYFNAVGATIEFTGMEL
jgi:hypothetical protein